MWSRAVRIRWKHLLHLNDTGPVVLLFKDGSAGLLTGANADQLVVFLKSPCAPAGAAPVAVDELRLAQAWAGEAVLLRANRSHVAADALFNFRWLVELVLQERRSLRNIGLASLTISFLTIFPPVLVMATVNRVLQFQSVSTLTLISVMMAVVFAYETLLGYARRLIIAVIGARLDAKLNLHVFNRLLRLPLDYFERHPAGETMYQLAQVYRVREFLTGRLLTTFLDLITLCVLLPFLFYLNAILAWIVLACAVVISLIILAYLNPLREMYNRVTVAETWKSAALGETIVGIKTVKALALEAQRKAVWDERVAETGNWRLAFARLANWPQTLVNPIERMMVLGTLLIGAYMTMNDPSAYAVGALFAFMMLSGRVAARRSGTPDGRLRGGKRRHQRGGIGAQPPAGDRCRCRWVAAEICRRHQFPGCQLHLCQYQSAGARPGELLGARRHDAGSGRAQRLGQVDDDPSVARDQPRLSRVRQDRRFGPA
jgi:ATP-binding cassette subfamily B protein